MAYAAFASVSSRSASEVFKADWALRLGESAYPSPSDLRDAPEQGRQVVAPGRRAVDQVHRRRPLRRPLRPQARERLRFVPAMVHAFIVDVDVDLRADKEHRHPEGLVEFSNEPQLKSRKALGIHHQHSVEVPEAEGIAPLSQCVSACVETRHVPQADGSSSSPPRCGAQRCAHVADTAGDPRRHCRGGSPEAGNALGFDFRFRFVVGVAIGIRRDSRGSNGCAARRRAHLVRPRLCRAAFQTHSSCARILWPQAAENVNEGGFASPRRADDSEVHCAPPAGAVNECRWRNRALELIVPSVGAEVEPRQPRENAKAHEHDHIHRRRRHYRAKAQVDRRIVGHR
mmetsp:Transcript_111985/g.321794  ORF Transcript_111985/g.321794 Transcript_111985/m.321794 type:complete len:343 (+) Transcript_111985:233-1261(+)